MAIIIGKTVLITQKVRISNEMRETTKMIKRKMKVVQSTKFCGVMEVIQTTPTKTFKQMLNKLFRRTKGKAM